MRDAVLSDAERAAIEGILEGAFGATSIQGAELLLGRHHAVRVDLPDGRLVVAKRPRRDRDGTMRDAYLTAWQRERWALGVLGGMPTPVAPRLLGADEDAQLLVMEAMPGGGSLAAVLLQGTAADATRALCALASSLGEVHAWCRERAIDGPEYDVADAMNRGLADLRIALDRASIPISIGPAMERESQLVTDAVAGRGPGERWRTIVHGDPCPDNARITADGRCRVFDYERAAVGNAAIDAVYPIAPMPTCWCFGRIPDDVSGAALEAYASSATAFPLTDLPRQMAFVLAASVFTKMRGLAQIFDQDQTWGTTGIRPRTLRWLDVLARTADAVDELPATRTLARDVHDALAERWPDSEHGWYPAFSPGDGASTVAPPDQWDPTW